jgi:inner membrane protein
MDTVTHLVAGAAIGEALAGKRVGKKAMFWGAVAAIAPDMDGITGFFVSDLDSIMMHRGITHSVFVALLAGPLFGWLLWKGYHKIGSLQAWMALVTLNLFGHLFLDTCTVYGTGLFTPFTEYRFAFDNIFVADPLYTLPLAAGVTALLVLPAGHPGRYRWNRSGLLWSSVYMAFTFWNHHNAISALKTAMERQGVSYTSGFAAPSLFNNVLWQVVAKGNDGCWSGYYSIFDGEEVPRLHFIPRNDSLLGDLAGTPEVEKLTVFSKGYYTVTIEEGNPTFNVIRFGQVRGWDDPGSRFAFAFNLAPGGDNSMVVQQGRVEGMKEEVLESMWNRMLSAP